MTSWLRSTLPGMGAAVTGRRDEAPREGLWRRMIAELSGRRPRRQDRTRELINEAETTRRDLVALTVRLTAHVAALQAYAREYARQQERSP